MAKFSAFVSLRFACSWIRDNVSRSEPRLRPFIIKKWQEVEDTEEEEEEEGRWESVVGDNRPIVYSSLVPLIGGEVEMK